LPATTREQHSFDAGQPESQRAIFMPDASISGRPDGHHVDHTQRSFPNAIDRFLGQAASIPNAIAVADPDGDVTYTGLEQRARTFAARFIERPEPRVLIALAQGADAYAAMIGTGLAGGFYAPVNAAAPIVKLRQICRMLQPDIIVGAAKLADELANESPQAVRIDPAALRPGDVFVGPGTRHETAYVIFTSGTTGAPKGVVIPQGALSHYVAWAGRSLEITAADRISQYASIAFDLSVLEIYGALCHGASLHPLTGLGDLVRPAHMIQRERLTVWISVPSVIGIMIQAHGMTPEALGSLRRFVFCGEPLMDFHLKAIFDSCPGVLVQNTYGPTEATVSMTSVVMTADTFERQCDVSAAIGTPIGGMGLHLAGGDDANSGELVITGPQLAAGYWQDPVRTGQSFRRWNPGTGEVRAYFTGDWAEQREAGIFFKARIDLQVKVKGFRIELEEIAAAIGMCGYPLSCVFKHEEHLVAVVEARPDQRFDAAALRQVLSREVEYYAVPEVIHAIDHLPRNQSGKIDRQAVISWYLSKLPC
jgi:D-alanine--poly(phosphoribitol) ligase subunit 1